MVKVSESVKVAICPFGQEDCLWSCYFRKGSRCCFWDIQHRLIPEIKYKSWSYNQEYVPETNINY